MNSQKNKVSLITPCYNGSAYLQQWVKCILAQSYPCVEIIFVDDGSTDNTIEQIEKYRTQIEAKGYGLLCLKKENGGAASAVNMALKYVTGAYVMLYDVDDIIMQDAIQDKAEFLDEHMDYGMVRNNGYYVKQKDLAQNSYLFIRKQSEKQNQHIFDDIVFGLTNNWTASFMIRTECLWDALQGKEIYISPWGQNLQIMLPVAKLYKTGFVDKALMRYIDHEAGVSRRKTLSEELMMFDGYKENRVEIIRRMNIPEEEKQKYNAAIEKLYLHIKLSCAAKHGDAEKAQDYYRELKEYNDVQIDDRINHLAGHIKCIALFTNKAKSVGHLLKCCYYKIEGKILRHDTIY